MSHSIDVIICGIPASVYIQHAHYNKPNHASWDSDIDYQGGWDLEYTICDRKGYPAPWLEKKMSFYDVERVEAAILENICSNNFNPYQAHCASL